MKEETTGKVGVVRTNSLRCPNPFFLGTVEALARPACHVGGAFASLKVTQKLEIAELAQLWVRNSFHSFVGAL